MRTLLINGSPAANSHTRALLNFLSEKFKEHNSDTEILDLLDFNVGYNDPLFHADASASPDSKVRLLVDKIDSAKIIVLGTPLYHGAFSGLLKSALDNLDDDAFLGKKILLVSNSSGLRNSQQAAQSLVVVGRTMGGTVYDRLIGTAKVDYKEVDGVLLLESEEIKKRCSDIVREIIEL